MDYSFVKLAHGQHRGRTKDIVQRMKIIYHSVNMSSIILLFFICFVSLIWCEHLNVSNLNCFNDYITTMACDFTSDKLLNCSGYILDFESPFQEHYACTLLQSEDDGNYYGSKCGCTVELPEFVSTEKYTVRLMDGRTVVHLTIITALDNIKPKAPKILLVMPMENGNYKVTWNTNYAAENPISESLQIQLMYNKKGKPDEAPRIANASQPFHEILGNELEPSSEYVVKARSRSPLYGTQFSDWSQEVEWTSSASVWNVLIAIIPVLCALLIISICAFYWCCTRLKDKWWDNIPTPTIEIKDKLLGNSEFFIPQNYDPSSYRTEFLTIVNTKEEPGPTLWISECEQVGPYKNVSSHTSTKDSGVFSSDDSQKTFSDSAGSCSSSDSGYKNVLYTTLAATPSQNTSSQALPSSGTPDLSARPAVGCEFCPIYREVEVLKATSPDPQKTQQEAPRIAIDCKYPVEEDDLKCPSGVDGLDDALPLNACRADDGYESFGEAVSRVALGQVRFPACTLEPSEEGYQALETLVDWRSEADRADRKASSVERTDQSTGQEWEPSQCPTWNIPGSITCASPFMQRSSMESSSNSALTTCPIMQIYTDSSYQRV